MNTNMKKLILPLLFVLGAMTTSFAQNYDAAIGLRLGYPTSISYKKFLSESNAAELWGGFRSFGTYNEISVNAGYQIHKDIESVDQLQWYYGAGAGVALYSYDFVSDDGGVGVSIAGYLGLEYTFTDLPIVISADWIPSFLIGGGRSGLGADGGALTVRYILGGEI